tara:strand:- start:20 stop:166 length:147 start_codon:yes stop_codon:yes gene_type:complete
MEPIKRDWDNWPGDDGKKLTPQEIMEVMIKKHEDQDEDYNLFEEGPSV